MIKFCEKFNPDCVNVFDSYDLPFDTTTKNVALFTIGDLIILGYKEARARYTLSTRESKLCNKNNNKIVISNSLLKKEGVRFRQ